MSLFNEASLYISPNGVKAGKLYAVKPTDGSGDLTVTRATSATRVNASGVIETVSANVPRLDYTNGSCPSILVEPQRTNMFTYSEQFDNLSWVKDNSTITTNSITSPNGTLTADKVSEDNTNNVHGVRNLYTGGGTNSISVYAKKAERDYICVFTGGGNLGGYFDLNNGTTLGTFGSVTTKIKDVGNGWYRCTLISSGSVLSYGSIAISNNGATLVYTGTTGSGVYIWGAQAEAGSYATSYIPTTTASVTRNADVITYSTITGITTITETFEDNTTNVISGSPTSYTMSNGRIKSVVGI